MADNARLNRVARLYVGDERGDLRALVRQAQAEIDALYPPGVGGATSVQRLALARALLQADKNGHRIPADTPYLGPTTEALVTRDARVTLPPPEEGRYAGYEPWTPPTPVTLPIIPPRPIEPERSGGGSSGSAPVPAAIPAPAPAFAWDDWPDDRAQPSQTPAAAPRPAAAVAAERMADPIFRWQDARAARGGW